jgi:hypothetical protein
MGFKAVMTGHHLILGTLIDFVTGEILPDTLDERYRQKLARLLVEACGFRKKDIHPRKELTVCGAGGIRAIVRIDFLVSLSEKIGMIVKFGPGSLVTRHRPSLAASRLVAPYQVPVAVVTNGETADVLDGKSGRIIGEGLSAVPPREALSALMASADFSCLSPKRREMESRILYAYEVDGACPCDDSVMRL